MQLGCVLHKSVQGGQPVQVQASAARVGPSGGFQKGRMLHRVQESL